MVHKSYIFSDHFLLVIDIMSMTSP